MKSKKKTLIAIAVVAVSLILIAVSLYIHMIRMWIKTDNLSHMDNWEYCITYEMFSDELKEFISEEEFNDRTPNGKYNMYSKLQDLELEAANENNPSTGWYKTPPCDSVTTDNGKYFIVYRIDFETHFNRIEVINFVTHISEINTY